MMPYPNPKWEDTWEYGIGKQTQVRAYEMTLTEFWDKAERIRTRELYTRASPWRRAAHDFFNRRARRAIGDI